MSGADLIAYLVNAAWQAPLLALGAWALTRLGTLGPRGRNRVWLACLLFAVVLPALSVDPAPHVAPHLIGASATPEKAFALDLDDRVALVLMAIFAGAAVIGLGRLLIGWVTVRRLLQGAQPVELPSQVLAELSELAAAHGARAPRILESAHTAGPVVVGAWRPTILTPAGFSALPTDEVRAALLHELAHVIRRDYAINFASEIIALPLYWHPASHVIKAEVRRSRELVCDAMASAAMRSQAAYAKSLIALAKSIDTPIARGASAGVGLFGKPLLEERLMQLIGPKRTPGRALKIVGLVGGGLIAAGVVSAVVFLHVPTVLAQPAKADPAAATQAAGETPREAAAKLRVMQLIDDPKIRREITRAANEAESPEFRVRAKAAVFKAMDDPETKAELARTDRLSRTTEARKAGQDLRAAAERLRDLDHAEKP